MKKRWKYRVYLPIAMAALLLASCAGVFLSRSEILVQPASRTLLVLKPDEITKEYIRGSEEGADSIAASDTALLLPLIDESLVMDNYFNAFVNQLQSIGFKVYTSENAHTFLSDSSKMTIINISQISLEEYFYPKRDSKYFGNTMYYEDVVLRALNLNIWLEVQQLNTGKPIKVLFASNFISDKLDGRFRYDYSKSEAVYQYSIEQMLPTAAYTLARRSGEIHAGYYFDYLLNKTMEESGIQEKYYVRFDRSSRKPIPAGRQRFFEVK